jgi:bacillithiol synthase
LKHCWISPGRSIPNIENVSIRRSGERPLARTSLDIFTNGRPASRPKTFMPSVTHVPFRNIPNQSALFLDYLDLSTQALRYFPCAPTLKNLVQTAQNRIANLQFDRPKITSILRRQNESFGCDSATLFQIAELERPDCFAVFTGQQVGLFAGPLYTVYKALTAIHLAEELKKHGIRAVPIFWMDTEDHDLAEVTHQVVIGAGQSVQAINYRNILFGNAELPPRSVGSIRFTESVERAVDDYVRRLPDSKWKGEVQIQLESTYKPGSTFAQSFAHLLSQILSGSGLIFFDPLDAEAKRLASGVFHRALCDADAIHAAVVQRNRELEISGFHSQVSVQENSSVLFYIDEGKRCALERRKAGFGLKNRDKNFGLEDLLDCLERAPENFSPNVLLRPLVQDHLFPTVAYVGGPAELAYFAQIETLYALFGQPMPVIWPRNSCTLLEPEVTEAMNRLRIDFLDCLSEKNVILERALHNAGHLKASDRIQGLQEHLDRLFTEISPEVRALDPSLVRALETARKKILHNFQHLRTHVIRSEGNQASSVLDSVDLLMSHCFPERRLQERELGIHHFLARRGPSLLGAIRSTMGAANFAHHVIQLD